MKGLASLTAWGTAAALTLASPGTSADENYVFKPGHPSLQALLLPETAPAPEGNPVTAEKVTLGKSLFFDPRLSGDGNMSCATCHNPSMGWSDGLPRGRGFKSMSLPRATPTVVNTGFNSIQMWDGREATLESQAMGPMKSVHEMNMDVPKLFAWLNQSPGYQKLFAAAFPGEPIDPTTLSKAIASFERTVVSNDSAFDRWVKGDSKAMNRSEIRGMKLFMGDARCGVCHTGANFTDNGFHNLGLASFGDDGADLGRYMERPLALMKGAFKTPTLRDIARTPPYFHDGSSATLEDVVEHYSRGGIVKDNLSPDMQPVDLSRRDKEDLVAFMQALTSPYVPITLPDLPL